MTSEARIEYPLGCRRRRNEALPLLTGMFRVRAARTFRPKQAVAIVDPCLDAKWL